MAEIAGLKLIVPSSVAGSGVSVSASGKVSFTAATSVSVNGCFSAAYDNYLVVVRGYVVSGSDNNLDTRLRASGTDAAGSNYAFQYLQADSTTVSGGRSTSQTEARTGYVSGTQRSGNHIYVYGPALAQPTAFRGVNVSGVSSARITDFASTHSLSTAYDGFSFVMGATSITGALCVYGLAQ